MLGRRDKAKGLEAEVQSLEGRRAGVLNRLTDATARHEAAIAEQRRFLTETDGADARQAKAVAEACRKAADDRAALEDAARTLAGLIEDAKARLAAERDRRERDRTAGEIEAGAAAIEAAALGLSRAATAFEVARDALAAACRDHAPKNPDTGGDCRYVIVSAAGRQAGILSREPNWDELDGFFHVTVEAAVAETLTGMRSRARAIREGLVSSSKPLALLQPPTPASFPEVSIVLAQRAYFRGFMGQVIELMVGGVTIPEPIAAQAMNLGIGFSPQSVPGAAIMRILRASPEARIEPDGNGSFRGVRFNGVLGDTGKGLPPADPLVDLGSLPDSDGVYAEAAE